jgi:hypothetical protein
LPSQKQQQTKCDLDSGGEGVHCQAHQLSMLLRTSRFFPQGTNGLIFGTKCGSKKCIPNYHLIFTSQFFPQGTNRLIFGTKCSSKKCFPNYHLIFNVMNQLSWQSSRIKDEVVLMLLVSVMCLEPLMDGDCAAFIAHHFFQESIQ